MRIAVVNKVLVARVSGCCRAQTATTETRSPQPMLAPVVVATGAVDKRVAVAVSHLSRSTGTNSHHVFRFDWLLLNLMLETVAAAVQGMSG